MCAGIHIDITVQARLTKTSQKGKRKRKNHSNGDQVASKNKTTHCKLWYVHQQVLRSIYAEVDADIWCTM